MDPTNLLRRLVCLLSVSLISAVDPSSAEPREPTEEAAPQAGHSYHGEVFNEGPRQAAYLMRGTGRVRFPVTANHGDVQAYVDQGVGQLHGFWYFEAERTFRQAAALDPDCAAAYWGMAMANANNSDRAKEFIKQAVERKAKASDRVQRYIDALDKRLNNDDEKKASNEYVQALERIVYDYPDDIEAKAFIAVHLWQSRTDDLKIRSHLAVDALIQQVLDVEPLHPIHHYRIHLWDNEKPERALRSAAQCGQSAPSIAHMWHMPGHIYSRLHRYPDAVWQQEASARTDHAQMMRDMLLPDQIHNFAHNNEWLIRNLIHVGRFSDALDLAKNMIQLPRHPKYNTLEKDGCSASYGRQRLIQVLTTGEMWEELLRLSETPFLEFTDDRMHQVQWLRAVGQAHHRLGHDAQVSEILAMLQQRLEAQQCDQISAGEEVQESADEQKTQKEIDELVKEARCKLDDDVRRIERAVQEIQAFERIAGDQFDQAIELLNKTNDANKGYLAEQHLRAGNADKAIEIAQKNVEKHKNETVPLAQLAWIQWQAGECGDAQKTMEKLRVVSSELDVNATPFTRLAPLISELGWPRDWRTALQPSSDVGNRPSLDSLGPFRWQPTSASDWTLTDTNGQRRSLADYQGQPVVAIFYLGFGCLHCAEQLHAFAPQADAFRKAGLEIVAISSDDDEGLRQSLEDFEGDIPFSLVADPDLDVFRRFRVFDDFEDQPLHGTFIIDATSRVRWLDISYEPFMDPEFVLQEAVRLLSD